jgi:endoglucanase
MVLLTACASLLILLSLLKTQRNVPVFCGELGVYIPNSNNTDRLRWYEAVRTYMEQKRYFVDDVGL